MSTITTEAWVLYRGNNGNGNGEKLSADPGGALRLEAITFVET